MEDYLLDRVFDDQLDEAIEMARRILVQSVDVQARIDLPPDAEIAARIARPGKEEVGKIVHGVSGITCCSLLVTR